MSKRKRHKQGAITHGCDGARERIVAWHGMAGACAPRLHLVEDRATALLLVSCTQRCAGQGGPAPLLVRLL